MSAESFFLGGAVEIRGGDCLEVVKAIPDDSIDSVVSDPPYALISIVKRFGATSQEDDTQTSERTRTGADGYARLARGFMGKEWDNGAVAFAVEFWREILRVLKPGGHVLAFSGTRTYHRLACAIEDAGFEIRDMVAWNYATGFPKSLNIGKKLDGSHQRCSCGASLRGVRNDLDSKESVSGCSQQDLRAGLRSDNDRNRQSQDGGAWPHCNRCGKPIVPRGLGTALKPAQEPICLARKPLEGTVAANVLEWGTGAINIDGTRVEGEATTGSTLGRWPANIVHDNSPEVLAMFGSAARFFYSAKANKKDRAGSKHPTVKPVALMQWLCRLVTPPGGLILDPFAGTGTTGEAAFLEGFRAILIEREAESLADIGRRMALVMAGPTERKVESIKARGDVAGRRATV